MEDEAIKSTRRSEKNSSDTEHEEEICNYVNQRLKLVFGEECGLRVEQNEYFIVTIVFDTLKNLRVRSNE